MENKQSFVQYFKLISLLELSVNIEIRDCIQRFKLISQQELSIYMENSQMFKHQGQITP